MTATLLDPDDDPGLFDPILPYAGTSGHSGTDTSEQRARLDDSSGVTSARQSTTLRQLKAAGFTGLTWHDLAHALDWHHGQASGTLSVLHGAGLIARLTESRNRSKVYVLPIFVDGRPTETPTVRKPRLSIPEGSLAIILPGDLVDKLSRGAAGSTITLPPGIADQIRTAARDAIEADV